jgi:hypothetical protein
MPFINKGSNYSHQRRDLLNWSQALSNKLSTTNLRLPVENLKKKKAQQNTITLNIVLRYIRDREK